MDKENNRFEDKITFEYYGKGHTFAEDYVVFKMPINEGEFGTLPDDRLFFQVELFIGRIHIWLVRKEKRLPIQYYLDDMKRMYLLNKALNILREFGEYL